MEILLPLLILGLVCGTYSSLVASAKGYEAPVWFFSGLLFGPLGLLASIGMPDLKLRRYLRLLAEHQGAVDKVDHLRPLYVVNKTRTLSAAESLS